MDDARVRAFLLERFADYLALEQGASPRTREAYARDVERLVDFAAARGARAPADVTARLLREFIYHLKDLGLAPASIRRGVSGIR
ncbi:MAG: site-specific integrase, partial [Gemmatimonadota bacterium]|nr:site-specific integrase [Gemmatimonadota bacterium]